MKTTKRILILLLAVFTAMTLCLPVFAQNEESEANKGSITIDNAIKDQEYTVYKVFDVEVGEIDKNGKPAIVYTYTASESDAFLDKLMDDQSPFVLNRRDETNVYEVTASKGAEDISGWFSEILKENTEILEGIDAKAEGNIVAFTGLDYGYYFVKTTTSAILTIDSLKANVTIQDKNIVPSKPDKGYKVVVDEKGKELDTSNVSYGDTVYYKLQLKATNYEYVTDETTGQRSVKKIVKYTAHDLLGDGLEDLTVTKVVVNKDIELDSQSGYSVVENPEDRSTEIVIPWVDDKNNFLYNEAYSLIEIYVQAVVNTNASIGVDITDSNLTNKGWFTWEYDDGENSQDPSGETTTVTSYVYALKICKVDAGKNPLGGAKFNIKDANGELVPVTLTSDSIYEYDPDQDQESPNYTVESNDAGLILVKGVAAGDYYLVETEAPKGYNILTEAVPVQASAFSSVTEITTVYKDGDGNITQTASEEAEKIEFPVAVIEVINNQGTELPSTGGMGTTVFYVVGGVLVLVAGVLLVVKKRMSLEK